jgi:pimeloyl-ACP methyl ester carboxylesterase
MPYAQLHGLKFYYETLGSGPPLVMIMGLGAHAGWWEPQTIDALACEHRILIFDNRDSGRSSLAPAPYSLRDMADDTLALMHCVGMERAHVLGASMGGMIAQELVLSRPDRVDKLVLACTSPGQAFGTPPTPKAMEGLMVDRGALTPEKAIELLVGVLFSPAWVAANKARLPEAAAKLGAYPISEEGYRRQLLAISGFEAGRRLRDVQAPTLILHGTADPLVPVENAKALAELIPGAKVELFEGCAHGFLSEQPEKFTELVRGFLAA